MTTSVRMERKGDFVTVTLCNPAKRNALSLEVLEELTAALEDISASDALGVILAAEGPVFSAGHNFGEMKGASEADALHLFTVCSNLMQTMHSIPQPIVARVHALATAARGCCLRIRPSPCPRPRACLGARMHARPCSLFDAFGLDSWRMRA